MSPPDAPTPAIPAHDLGAAAHTPEQAREVRLWLTVLGILAAGGWIGALGVARLANDLPLLLIALSPLNRHFVLVAPTVHPAAFFGVGIGRSLLGCYVAWRLARAAGEPGLRWLEASSPSTGRFVRMIERMFERSAIAAILVWPGFLVSLLAGLAGMRLRVLLPLAAAGLMLRLTAILWLGQWLMEPIQWLLAAIDRYWIPVTAVIVAAALLHRWRMQTRARTAT